MRSTFFSPIRTSAQRALYFARLIFTPSFSATKSIARNPALWRVSSYSLPGLPSPATIYSGLPVLFAPPDEICLNKSSIDMVYSFLLADGVRSPLSSSNFFIVHDFILFIKRFSSEFLKKRKISVFIFLRIFPICLSSERFKGAPRKRVVHPFQRKNIKLYILASVFRLFLKKLLKFFQKILENL